MSFLRWLSTVLVVGALGACGHAADPATNPTPKAADAETLAAPARADDLPAWRDFAGKAILAETHDPDMHPYTFVVPSGDTREAEDGRRAVVSAIHGLLGQMAVPGNMIVVTGADPDKSGEALAEAFKDVPARSLPYLSVLYVGSTTGAIKAASAVKASGAELRTRAMRPIKG